MSEQFLLEWWEDYMPACGEYPRELHDCGWRCPFCKEDLGSYLTRTTDEAGFLVTPIE